MADMQSELEQISAMLEGGGSDESTEPVGDEESVESRESSEETRGEEDESVEETSGDEESRSTDEEVSSEDSTEDLKREIAELRGQLKQLSGDSSESDESSAKPAEVDLTPQKLDFDPLKDVDFSEVFDDEDAASKFKSTMSQVLDQVFQAGQKVTYEKFSAFTDTQLDRKLTVKEQADEFYRNHPDLSKHRDEVAKSFKAVRAANPDSSWEQIFSETARYARYRLGLNENSEEGDTKKTTKKSKPALNSKSVKSSSRKTTQDSEPKGEEKEILDLLKVVDQ
jgi:hypothetical protein